MTKDEALKLALEAIHDLEGEINGYRRVDFPIPEKAKAVIKEALAQPAPIIFEYTTDRYASTGNGTYKCNICCRDDFRSEHDVVWHDCQGEKYMTKDEVWTFIPTMGDAIAAGDGVLMNEQALLLRQCRHALDDLLRDKPMLAAKICGTTTLGNLKAMLYEYRPQGVFGDKK